MYHLLVEGDIDAPRWWAWYYIYIGIRGVMNIIETTPYRLSILP